MSSKTLAAFIALVAMPLFAQQPIIIDHRCIDLTGIPAEWIAKAQTDLRVTYQHTSHGSQLVTGIDAIADHLGGGWSFTASGWGYNAGVFLNDYGMPDGADLGSGGDLTWRDVTEAALSQSGFNRNVVMWSWCGGVSGTNAAGIDAYLNAMRALETAHPTVRFIYITGHLDGTGRDGNLTRMNDRIRDYCRTNGRILFDFADIESFDPTGAVNFMEKYATDGCEYDANDDGNPWGDANWASEWIAAHPNHLFTRIADGCGSCAHSEALNCVMKGGAFWWLMARLAGWNGQTTEVGSMEQPMSMAMQSWPNPTDGMVTLSTTGALPGPVSIEVSNSLGQIVRRITADAAGPWTIDLRGCPPGLHAWRMTAGNRTSHGTVILRPLAR